MENLVRTGVSGVSRLRRAFRTLKQEGVFSGCGRASLFEADCHSGSTVMATADCVDGPKSQSVGSAKMEETYVKSLKSIVRVARIYGSSHRGGCSSRCSFLPHLAGTLPPLPTLACHFLSPARTRSFSSLSFTSPSLSSAGILIKLLML